MDVNSGQSEKELKLLDLVRQHIKREKEIIVHLKEKNVASASNLIIQNVELAEKIRSLFDDFYDGYLQLRDFEVVRQLRMIRNHSSETDKLLDVFTKLDYIDYEEIPKSELEDKERESLDEMIDYFMSEAGYSLGFSQRKKDFGTLIVKSSVPKNIGIFLNQIKNCYLLNMNEAAIGLCRILLEVACRSIYDRSKGVSYMDEENYVQTMIRKACEAGGLSPNKVKKATSKYKEASDILHGKLPKRMNDKETLNFVRDVFSIIEALY